MRKNVSPPGFMLLSAPAGRADPAQSETHDPDGLMRPHRSAVLSLSESDGAKVAQLAKLKLNEPQVPEYAAELSGILEMVETLDSAETDGVTPMAHPLDLSARLRADSVTETDQRDAFQAIAPKVEDGVYLVPRVIE
jgi:aspartyl-tRNA(Asn)/glutamyl-tRNA(Gln) amidotransferase subunit C